METIKVDLCETFGFSVEEARDFARRSDALISILLHAKERRIKKPQLKKLGNLSFLECNSLYQGNIDKFSIERLVEIADEAGLDSRYIDKVRDTKGG